MSEPKTPNSQETQPIREIDPQTKKHIDRLKKGPKVWNKWANKKLTEKAELEKKGKWEISFDFDKNGGVRTISEDTSRPEIQRWLDETYVNFSNICFVTDKIKSVKNKRKCNIRIDIDDWGGGIYFAGFIFPGIITFFGTEFNGYANFYEAKFLDKCYFKQVSFFNGAQFSEVCFYEPCNFEDSKFHKTVLFHKTKFSKVCIFDRIHNKKDISFKSAEFKGVAYFNKVKFNDAVSFGQSKFRKSAFFKKAKFLSIANFDDLRTYEKIIFDEAKFYGIANFSFSNFKSIASFIRAEFMHVAHFSHAKFYKNINFGWSVFRGGANFNKTAFQQDVYFNQVDFDKHVDFPSAAFYKQVNFGAIFVKRGFNMEKVKFASNVPNFTQANFAESPRLDNVEVLPVPRYESAPKIFGSLKWQRYFWKKKFISYLFRIIRRFPLKLFHLIYFPLHYIYKRVQHSCIQFFNTRCNPNEEAHYRALKRLAIQAHDHENEMKFFAGEIRARRHVTDFANFLTHDFASSMRYWAGVAYELFSDFGRSFIRPTLWWFACLWLFANLTLSGAGLVDTTKCHNSQLTPKEAAYTIGLKNSLLILGFTKTNIVKQAELCLYGLNKNGKNKNGEVASNPKPYDPKIKRAYQAKSAKVENTKTDIPFKAAVQGIAHSLLSLLFIFLLLLAIRNQFKIK